MTLQVNFDAIEEIEILLDEEIDFAKCILRDGRGKTIQSLSDEKELIELLQQMPYNELDKYAAGLRGLYIMYQLALKLVQQSAYIPQFVQVSPKSYKVRWLPAALNDTVRSLITGVQALVPQDVLFYKNGKEINEPIDAEKTIAVLSLFINYLVQTNHNLTARFREHEIGHLFLMAQLYSFKVMNQKVILRQFSYGSISFLWRKRIMYPSFKYMKPKKGLK